MSELLNYLVQNDESFRRARLPALYSDFRSQRTLNPDGFTANVAAWKRGLSSATLAGHVPSKSTTRNHLTLDLDGDSLLQSLETKQFGRPLALGTALQDALANEEMMPLQQFLKAKESIYHRSWGTLPWTVMSWGLRQVGIRGPGDNIPKGQFVMLQNLDIVSRAFSEATADRASPFERTFSKAHFQRTFADGILEKQRLSETDLEVLVKFLSRDKNVLVTDGNTIKIRKSSQAENVSITEEDSAIASLKELMEDLTRQAEALNRRIDELNIAAQDAVRKKNRISAMAALKSKRLAETDLSKRHTTLSQLEDVAAKIQQATDNVQLVKVMQSSTVALRNLNAQVGGADKVDEVLDNLRQEMGEVDEVGNIIAEGGAVTVDEAEVDDEFEAMMAEERKKEEEAERVKREAQKAKEADETRRKLAELEKLAPLPVPSQTGEKEARPITPVTATANELDEMHIDTDTTTTTEGERTAQMAE
ncbi:Snf7-domain-containing protein [Hypoxylon sp. FL1284]|nr:Snf7-domain-containing protein [Hypoxylon sp. FL1284]